MSSKELWIWSVLLLGGACYFVHSAVKTRVYGKVLDEPKSITTAFVVYSQPGYVPNPGESGAPISEYIFHVGGIEYSGSIDVYFRRGTRIDIEYSLNDPALNSMIGNDFPDVQGFVMAAFLVLAYLIVIGFVIFENLIFKKRKAVYREKLHAQIAETEGLQ